MNCNAHQCDHLLVTTLVKVQYLRGEFQLCIRKSDIWTSRATFSQLKFFVIIPKRIEVASIFPTLKTEGDVSNKTVSENILKPVIIGLSIALRNIVRTQFY